MCVVFLDPSSGFGDGFRFREGVAIREFGPRAAFGESVADGVGDVIDE